LLREDKSIFRKGLDYLTSCEKEIRKKIKDELKEIIEKFKSENKKLGFIFSTDE
jgi:hypothetical protein